MCIRDRTGGKDGIYYTYTDESPISFNPFFTEDKVFDIEKRESIKTCLLYTSPSSLLIFSPLYASAPYNELPKLIFATIFPQT